MYLISVASTLLFHEFRWARFSFYCEKKAISDQRLLTASGRRVICEYFISSCGSRRMAWLYLWQRKESRTNTHKQTHDGGGSRTLQTSVLQACLHLHMPRLLHVSSLWSVYLQENLEGGKMLRVSFWAQTCSLHIDVFIVVFIISNASSLCSKPGFLHV